MPAFCAAKILFALQQLRGPVFLLDQFVQLSQLGGQFVHLLLHIADTHGADNLNFAHAMALHTGAGAVQKLAQDLQLSGETIPAGQQLRQRSAVGQLCFIVGAVDPGNEIFQVDIIPIQLLQQLLGILCRNFSLLHQGVVVQPHPELMDPGLQLRPLGQCIG